MKADVLDAYLYASENGYENLEKRIRDRHYATRMYAIDPDDTVLAVSRYDEALFGLSFLNARDSYDSPYVEKATYVARQGGGYTKYLFPVDGTLTSAAGQFSISYVIPVENTCFLLGYTAVDSRLLPVDRELKTNVGLVSRAVVKTAHDKGVVNLSEIVMSTPDASGSMFVYDADYETDNILILDYDGYAYADTQDPAMVGQSLTHYTDALQTSITRTAIMLAKSGGGVMYDFQKVTNQEGYCDLWLYSVEPIDDNYFVLYGTVVHTVKNVTITDP